MYQWKQLRTIALKWVSAYLKDGEVVDGCNLYHPEDAKAVNLRYISVGRI